MSKYNGHKALLAGFMAALGAAAVTGLIFHALIIYSIGYSIWLSVKTKDRWAWAKFWLRFINGVLFAIGDLLYAFGYFLDQLWNVAGELIEDTITHVEDTYFGKEEITVSASIGEIKERRKLNRFGKFIDKLLNIAFMQHNHSVGAWKFYNKKKEIHEEYFQPKKKK